MNNFRKLGLIDYHSNGALTVHSHLLRAVLRDQPSLNLPVIPTRTLR
jgi:hypothetical protein